MILTKTFQLERGWTYELVPDAEAVVLIAADGVASVTVDFDGRCFRRGRDLVGAVVSSAPYVGRGWRDRLCGDAAAWLAQSLTP